MFGLELGLGLGLGLCCVGLGVVLCWGLELSLGLRFNKVTKKNHNTIY